MKKVLLLLYVLLSLYSCTSSSSKIIHLEKGHVQFNNVDQIPNTIYHLRGKMEIEIFEDFIIVKQDQDTYIISSSHLVYAGSGEFGD